MDNRTDILARGIVAAANRRHGQNGHKIDLVCHPTSVFVEKTAFSEKYEGLTVLEALKAKAAAYQKSLHDETKKLTSVQKALTKGLSLAEKETEEAKIDAMIAVLGRSWAIFHGRKDHVTLSLRYTDRGWSCGGLYDGKERLSDDVWTLLLEIHKEAFDSVSAELTLCREAADILDAALEKAR